MQGIFDLIIVVLMLGFLWLVLKELAQSQKMKQDLEPPYNNYLLTIKLYNEDGITTETLEYVCFDYAQMQQLLNSFQLFRLRGAKAVKGGKITHRMNNNGVLEAV